jgi:hypothetical protein
MFDFFKRKLNPGQARLEDDYQAEFQKRTRILFEKFAIEDTPYDDLVEAMASVRNEMMRNGGCNWSTGYYDDYLLTIRRHLTADSQFSNSQLEKIEWSIGEIDACGMELKRDGESRRAIEEPIDCLIERVVDWCRTHEPESTENA